jgi:hypothetical protein
MHQTASQHTVAEDQRRIDQAILALLLEDQAQPWAIDELGRAIGNEIEVADSIARLYAAGLIHRLDHFVFPTRGARRAAVLMG